MLAIFKYHIRETRLVLESTNCYFLAIVINPATLTTFALLSMSFKGAHILNITSYLCWAAFRKSNNSKEHFIKNLHITIFWSANNLLLLILGFPHQMSHFVLLFNFCQLLDEKRAHNVSLNHFLFWWGVKNQHLMKSVILFYQILQLFTCYLNQIFLLI